MLSNCLITNKLLYIPSFGIHLTYFICPCLCIYILSSGFIITLCTALCAVCVLYSMVRLRRFGDINIQVKYLPKMECYRNSFGEFCVFEILKWDTSRRLLHNNFASFFLEKHTSNFTLSELQCIYNCQDCLQCISPNDVRQKHNDTTNDYINNK